MSNQAGIRLAVIDTDTAFLTVLAKRLEGAGWEHRVLAGSVPVEELVAMMVDADIARLSQIGYHAFLVGERLIAQSDPGAALRELVGT